MQDNTVVLNENVQNTIKRRVSRHRNRYEQVPIYLKKLFRMFVYQKDWIKFPFAVIIAGMVSLVIRHGFGQTMEGTAKGAFALTCVAIWNGGFNSIQVICRERAIIKREHRSGMHMTSYIIAHMIYQAFLCSVQSVLTVYVCRIARVKLSMPGVITPSILLDLGLTVFLVSYASSMLSLLVSSIARTTTAAMTVMPFILIFQLIFSGGIFTMPSWAEGISKLTISNYGMCSISSQAHYNELKMSSGWNLLKKLENIEIIDDVEVKDVIEFLGEEEVKDTIEYKMAAMNQLEKYDDTKENIYYNWSRLIAFAIMFAALSIVVLEFIDRDKR